VIIASLLVLALCLQKNNTQSLQVIGIYLLLVIADMAITWDSTYSMQNHNMTFSVLFIVMIWLSNVRSNLAVTVTILEFIVLCTDGASVLLRVEVALAIQLLIAIQIIAMVFDNDYRTSDISQGDHWLSSREKNS